MTSAVLAKFAYAAEAVQDHSQSLSDTGGVSTGALRRYWRGAARFLNQRAVFGGGLTAVHKGCGGF